MIILKLPTDRLCVPVRDAIPGRVIPHRVRLVARWQQDVRGWLFCRWRAPDKPSGNPSG